MKIKPQIIFLVALLLLPMMASASETGKGPTVDPFIVVLDAVHGGHDPGNLGNGYLEKDIALKIELKVGELLSATKDIKVIYTRKDDTFVDLFVRGEIANKANADLFVSVHCDSHNSDAHGAGTFVLGLHANKQNFEIAKKENSENNLGDNYETRYADYDINSPESVIGLTIMQEEFLDQSIALAKNIQDNMSGRLKRVDRKVKQAGFIVLHQTFMPSVLVETGFLTNKDEGAYLNSSKGQAEMGTAIADAIIKYKTEVQGVSQSAQVSNPVTPEKALKDEATSVAAVVVAKEEASETKEAKKPEQAVKKQEVLAVSEPKETVEEKPDENAIIYKVQLMASSKDLALSPENFKGLPQITKEAYNNLYRYMYGATQSYREAKMLQSKAARTGYPSAYIVAYKKGERVSVPKEVEEESQ